MTHEGTAVASLGPGDHFGEMVLLGDGRRKADVVASSPMTIFAMFGTAFREMESGYPLSRLGSERRPRSASPSSDHRVHRSADP